MIRTGRKQDAAMTTASDGTTPSFAQDVKPLFRDKDRDSMRRAFDLFDYADVSAHADAIVGALRGGKMPCDGAWPADRVDLVQRWIDAGKPA
jgi:hypothetical protein